MTLGEFVLQKVANDDQQNIPKHPANSVKLRARLYRKSALIVADTTRVMPAGPPYDWPC